jgi:DNA-binding IclR family transcriptional regulator
VTAVVRSVISKVSAILPAVAEDGQSTLTEIGVRSDLALSTTHRLVAELTADTSFRDRAAPVMEDPFRATGAWMRVGYLDGPGVAYIE